MMDKQTETVNRLIYSRKMARNKWRKLTCKQRNHIKWICDEQDEEDLHAGFAVYKQML